MLAIGCRFLGNVLRLFYKLLPCFHALAFSSIGGRFFPRTQGFLGSIREVAFARFKAWLPRRCAPFLARPIYKAALLGLHDGRDVV